MKLTALVALSITSAVNAGQVISYVCGSESARGDGLSLSTRVHYNNKSDGCQGLNAFDAYSGIVHPSLGFKKFCGDDGFCANVDLFGTAGLHIILDGKDVALGNSESKQEYYDDATAKAICAQLGYTSGTTRLRLNISQWNNVPKTKCK